MCPGGASILTGSQDIRIEAIRVRDLQDFTRRAVENLRGDQTIPLTPQRALAYAANPCASETDIGLLVAYCQDKCAGYLGIMPGRLLVDDALYPVYWFSTWFVPPEFRSTGVAVRLLSRALTLDYDLAVTGTSQQADRVYRALGFREVGPLRFKRLRLPGNALLKRYAYGVLLRPYRSALKEIATRQVARLSEGFHPPLTVDKGNPCFYRDVSVVNWMLEHPWILETARNPGPVSSYAFSDRRDRFRYVAMEIHGARADDLKGYLVLSISTERSRTIVKVLDFHIATDADLGFVFPLAVLKASLQGADQIDLPREVCDSARPGALTRLLLRSEERACFLRPRDARSPLATAQENVRLSYCDGDMAFV